MAASMPGESFLSAKILIGIFTMLSMVMDCKSVEIPPKLITKLQRIAASLMFERFERLRQPFVISITPSRKYAMLSGKRFKIGEKHSMTMKNMVIMQPTESMASVEEGKS